MFTKATVSQAPRALSGKDVKVLRANVQAAFPNIQTDQVSPQRPTPTGPPAACMTVLCCNEELLQWSGALLRYLQRSSSWNCARMSFLADVHLSPT